MLRTAFKYSISQDKANRTASILTIMAASHVREFHRTVRGNEVRHQAGPLSSPDVLHQLSHRTAISFAGPNGMNQNLGCRPRNLDLRPAFFLLAT